MGDCNGGADSENPPISTFITRLRETAPQLPQSRHGNSTFYRNIEEVLDLRRTTGTYWSAVENQWQVGDAVDFCSGDICTICSCLKRNTYPHFQASDRMSCATKNFQKQDTDLNVLQWALAEAMRAGPNSMLN